jgi:thiosulfate/3-mercaptopyruvate sulfurtransferase
MKPLLCILLAISISVTSFAKSNPVPVLVDAQWLKAHRSDKEVVILQANFIRLDFEKEHIPGARFLWPDWLAAHSPEGNFNAPTIEVANRVLQSLGINKESHVVLVFTKSDITVTARMFLTLEHLGLYGQVSFLDGGLEAWKYFHYDVVTGASPIVNKGNFTAKYMQLLVDKNYVQNALLKKDKLVVDARLKRFYDGDPTGNPRDGHITGALNLPFPDLIDSFTCIKPVAELQAYFDKVNTDKNKEMIGYCFIGQTASVVYLAGRILGYPMRIYDGSLQEWSRLPELPMEKSK